jgi:hypothetical protein
MNKELILRAFAQRKVPNATDMFIDWGRDSLFVQTSDPKEYYDFKISDIINAFNTALAKIKQERAQ